MSDMSADAAAECRSPRFLYRDSVVAVVLKYAGEICEAPSEDIPPEQRLPRLLASLPADEGSEDFIPVHRLDRPVSGCVVCAAGKKHVACLSSLFSSSGASGRRAEKRYWAIVEGRYPRSSVYQQLSGMVRFDRRRQKTFVCSGGAAEDLRSGWKKAGLKWRSFGCGDRYSFLEVVPLTGRTHQIRAQLAADGMPVKGDVKYGARRSDPLGGIRLHARSVCFPHPADDRPVEVSAPVPVRDALWDAFFSAAGVVPSYAEKTE